MHVSVNTVTLCAQFHTHRLDSHRTKAFREYVASALKRTDFFPRYFLNSVTQEVTVPYYKMPETTAYGEKGVSGPGVACFSL